ncbi:ImmA/IrrE family metallo-endopeptidase [Microvirga sp. CF3062]|uniref:ImmA/IrrE family metallo-endopeptidase n=1 Tax=Microvirga sp. CF3062 TaxID=3110182 RepID=UPI002E75FF2A|nr:ImmA/IrrE family metallo-endopeptidase [Microvirga sp. CF3062]MEE1655776.1 ImmA/IrrE family metallo-endopeptidase [Microvirga sp. CF3062]
MVMQMNVLEKIKSFQNDAPVNIEGLIRSFGVSLDKKAVLHPEIAGQIERVDGDRFHVAVNVNDHYYRQRFTMAHELGHYLMHRDLLGEGTDDNRAYRSIDAGKFHNTSILPQHETEANRFAANLLMPAHLVKRYFYELNGELERLSKIFQVSSEAMRHRLASLDLKPRAFAERVG